MDKLVRCDHPEYKWIGDTPDATGRSNVTICASCDVTLAAVKIEK